MFQAENAKSKSRVRILGLVFLLLFSGVSFAFAAYAPTIGTLTPSSGTSQVNQEVIFTATFSDRDGWQNLRYGYFLVNTAVNGLRCFYGYYDGATNKLYLRNDANTAWLGGFAPGSNNIIQNSYVKLNCLKTTVSGSGTTLTLKCAITFKSTFTGTKNIYLLVRDISGLSAGWTLKGKRTIISTVDTTPPLGLVKINNNAAYASSALVALSLDATDLGSGMGTGAQMQFSSDNISWSAAEAYATTKSWTLAAGDGNKTVYVKFKDAAGNWSAAATDTIILDTTASSVPTVTDDGATTANKIQLHASWSSADAVSGIVEYQYQILQDSTTGVVIVGWTSAGTTAEITKTGLGLIEGKNYYFAVKAKNGAGLFSTVGYSDGIRVVLADAIPPTGTVKINNDYPYTSSTSVTLNLASQDNSGGSGVTQMQFSNDNLNWSAPEAYSATKFWTLVSGEGVKTVYVKFRDAAGNWSSVATDTITSDTTPPQLSFSSPSAGAIIAGVVNITANATDSSAGVSKVEFYLDDAPLLVDVTSPYSYTWDTTISTNGAHTLKIIAYDNVTNVVIKTINITVNNQASGQKYLLVYSYATSSTGSNVALNTIDGNMATYWEGNAAAGYWWCSVNLERSLPVSRISIYWKKDFGSTQYYILGSNDNTNFARLAGPFSSAGGTVNPQRKDHALSGSYNYVALEIITSQATTAPIIYEIEVYGGQTQDTIPPTGTIKINNDAQYTNTAAVTLSLAATDSGSGMGTGAQMQFSNDNVNWSAAEAYTATKSWTLASGDGTKTVYVKFKDVAGNWSTAVTDTIILDTAAPGITSVSPADGSRKDFNVLVTLSAQVTDTDSSPLEYQFSVDNQIKQVWGAQATYQWQATPAGVHLLKIEIRDAGGQASKQVEIFSVRRPVPPEVFN